MKIPAGWSPVKDDPYEHPRMGRLFQRPVTLSVSCYVFVEPGSSFLTSYHPRRWDALFLATGNYIQSRASYEIFGEYFDLTNKVMVLIEHNDGFNLIPVTEETLKR